MLMIVDVNEISKNENTENDGARFQQVFNFFNYLNNTNIQMVT